MVSSAAFFSGAGELLGHVVKVEAGFTGTREGKDVAVVTFTYERGVARYDGEGWAFALNELKPSLFAGWDAIPT